MSGSSETCGWMAALVSCVAFGSFAVPVKSDASKRCNVDPLVFQSYKTFVCFITSFLSLPLFHQPLYFTAWGIVSAAFWVPAGVLAIYAVKNAGLAISQGVWSSFIVLISFIWGIFIFNESVKSRLGASFAILTMIIGLWGMSFYSSPMKLQDSETQEQMLEIGLCQSSKVSKLSPPPKVDSTEVEPITNSEYNNDLVYDDRIVGSSSTLSVLSQRKLGLIAAVCNGVWGGSIMVPMHYAPVEAEGTGYVVSFGIGAVCITTILWIVRFNYEVYLTGPNYSIARAIVAMPSFHMRLMWKPGCLAGLLWSIGNVASMISVQNLGEGVGYSVTQASMLCSGLWGLFYFNEVPQRNLKIKWLISATITVTGILLLSYEHQSE